MLKKFLHNGLPFTVEIQKQGRGFYTGLTEDGKADTNLAVESFHLTPSSPGRFQGRALGRDFHGVFLFIGGEYFVHIGGRNYRFHDAHAAGEEADSSGIFKSPMPGKVTAVLVKEGDIVKADQTLLIVEAMKMENAIKSDLEGKVKRIGAKAGDLVTPEDVLAEVEPA